MVFVSRWMLFVSFLRHSPSHSPEGNLVYIISIQGEESAPTLDVPDAACRWVGQNNWMFECESHTPPYLWGHAWYHTYDCSRSTFECNTGRFHHKYTEMHPNIVPTKYVYLVYNYFVFRFFSLSMYSSSIWVAGERRLRMSYPVRCHGIALSTPFTLYRIAM